MKRAYKSITPSLALLCIVMCGACFVGPAWVVDFEYSASARRVESKDVESRLVISPQTKKIDLLAADDLAQFSFAVSPGHIVVSIENRQSELLEIDLEAARFKDWEGRRLPMVAWTLAESGKRAAVVSADHERQATGGSVLKLSLWPEAWTHEYSGQPVTRRDLSPFGGEGTVGPTPSKAREGRKNDVGKQFEIVLPVRFGSKLYSYHFTFTATELRTKRVLWA